MDDGNGERGPKSTGGGAAGQRGPEQQALSRAASDPAARAVAVTGAYSYLGSELIKRLEADRRYARVLAVDVQRPAFPTRVTQFHKVDLTVPTADADLADIFVREGVDTVVHGAFLSSPTHDTSWAHELEAIGTMHVLNACGEAKVHKLVALSTTMLYGANPSNPNFLTEEHETRGHAHSRYINDKLEAERQVRRFRNENPQATVTVLRAAAVLGPSVRNFLTRFFRRPVAPILMGYDPLLQFVHERDLVDAFVIAVDRDVPGIFNIAGDGVLPYTTVLAMMGKIPLPMPTFLAYPLSRALWLTQVFDSPPSFLDFLRYLCVADGDKAKREMGFHPRYDIKATIHDFLGMLPGQRPARSPAAEATTDERHAGRGEVA